MESTALQALGYVGGRQSTQLAKRVMRLAKSTEAQQAAKVLQRLARGRNARTKYVNRLRGLGEVAGTDTSKRSEIATDGWQLKAQNTLHIQRIALLPQDATKINARNRQTIYLGGFKVCMQFDHVVGSNYYCNLAVVAGKFRGEITGTDFFRGNGENRQLDFTASITAFDRHCLPLNSDEFHVLKHIRFDLHADVNENPESTKQRRFEFYVPVNRQIRYEDSTSVFPETDFALCYWFGEKGQNNVASQDTSVSPLRVEYKVIQFFREPQPLMSSYKAGRIRYV